MLSQSDTEITVRIDPRNLAELTATKVPTAYLWLEDNGDGTYALCGSIPFGDEAKRNLPNRHPDATLPRLTEEQRTELVRKWEEKGGEDRWGEAVQRVMREIWEESR